MKIFAIGDSHSIVFHKAKHIIEHWIGFSGNKESFSFPLTMHRLASEGLDITRVPSILGNGHEKFVPQKGDIVILTYGFNDVNKNVGLQQARGREVEEIIDTLARNHVQKVVEIGKTYEVTTIPYWVVPPSRREDLPNRNGTPHERLVWSQMLDKAIQAYCKEHSIPTWGNTFDFLVGKEGFLRDEYCSKDGVHIDVKMIDVLENAIIDRLFGQTGFILSSYCKTEEQVRMLGKCIESIRKYYPYHPIHVIDDFSPTNLPDVLRQYDRVTCYQDSVADMINYEYFLHRTNLEKAVLMQDSMFLECSLGHHLNEDYLPLWYATNHINQWDSLIVKPDCIPDRFRGSVRTHTDHILAHIRDFDFPEDFRRFFLNVYHRRHEWNMVFGPCGVISRSFLLELNEKTNILAFMRILRTNWQRRIAETVFYLAVKYVYGDKYLHKALNGLYYDGVHDNPTFGKPVEKEGLRQYTYCVQSKYMSKISLNRRK